MSGNPLLARFDTRPDAVTLPGRTAPLPEGGTAVLYLHDGGEVECGATPGGYRPGHSSTLFYASQADPTAREVWTELGTWERVTAETVAWFAAHPMPDGSASVPCCEVCGATPLT